MSEIAMEDLAEFQKRLSALGDNLLPGLHRAQADLQRLANELDEELSARQINWLNEISASVERQQSNGSETPEHFQESLQTRKETCRLRATRDRLESAISACNQLFQAVAEL